MKRIYREQFQRLWLSFKGRTEVQLYNPEQMQDSHGRKVGLSLAIKIDEADIRNKIISIANGMDDIPGLYLFPPEYYHITVKILGFVSEVKLEKDDIVPKDLDNLIHQIALVFKRIPTFTLEIGTVNSLGSFIILEVEDGGNISLIQQEFREITNLPGYELEAGNWLPHLSIAAFQSLEQLEKIKIRLGQLRGERIGMMKVKRIDLVEAGLQKPFPKLRAVHSYRLNH